MEAAELDGARVRPSGNAHLREKGRERCGTNLRDIGSGVAKSRFAAPRISPLGFVLDGDLIGADAFA